MATMTARPGFTAPRFSVAARPSARVSRCLTSVARAQAAPGAVPASARPSRSAPSSSVKKARVTPRGRCGEKSATRGDAAVAAAAGTQAAQETIAGIMGDALPPMIQQPLGLTLSQTFLYSAAFALGLVVLVGTLRPALVVLHNAWDSIWGGRAKHNPFTDSFFGWSYRIMRTALLAVALAWTYVIIVPVASKSRALTFTRGYPPRTTITPASIPSRPWALGSRRKWRR